MKKQLLLITALTITTNLIASSQDPHTTNYIPSGIIAHLATACPDHWQLLTPNLINGNDNNRGIPETIADPKDQLIVGLGLFCIQLWKNLQEQKTNLNAISEQITELKNKTDRHIKQLEEQETKLNTHSKQITMLTDKANRHTNRFNIILEICKQHESYIASCRAERHRNSDAFGVLSQEAIENDQRNSNNNP